MARRDGRQAGRRVARRVGFPGALCAAAAVVAVSSGPSGLTSALSPVGPIVSSARSTAPAPLDVNGKHVFWADGVPTAGRATVSSAALNNLIYHGGLVETTQKVYLVFWGSEWSDPGSSTYTIPVKDSAGTNYTLADVQSYVQGFFGGIGGTAYNDIQSQYCQGGSVGDLTCGAGTSAIENSPSVLGGVWNDTGAADEPGPVIDTLGLAENAVPDPVAAEAEQAATHFAALGQYKPGDLNATFFVYAPPGRVVSGATPYGAYCGYHTEVTNLPGHGIRYAFIPYILDVDLNQVNQTLGNSCGMDYVNKPGSGLYDDSFGNGVFDGFSIVSGHEYAEAVTDPDNLAFQDGWNDAQTNENGDKCAWIASGQGAAADLAFATGTFAVQSLWSNAFASGQGGCVLGYP